MWRHLVASQKSLFRWEIPKIITLPGQSFEQGQLDHQQFGNEMPDTCGDVIEGSTFLIDFLAQKRMSQEVKEGSKMLFLYFFDPFGPQLILITTKTGTDLEHYVTCINSPVNFYNGLY